MTNSKNAFPEMTIQCEDRARKFCLNLGAFRLIEEYMSEKTGNENYSVFDDFNWTTGRLNEISLILWAGLATDASKDKEKWTIEKAESVITLIGLTQAKDVIAESLSRVLSKEQIEAQVKQAQKKSDNKSLPSSIQTVAKKSRKKKS